MKMERVDVLVLGNGIAGRTAAETVRSCNAGASILIVSHEDDCLRPLLTKSGVHRMGSRECIMPEQSWYREKKIDFLNAQVTELLPEAHAVTTDKGTVSYGKCVYALGSEAFCPPIPGSTQEGVFAIRRAVDVLAVKRRLPLVKRAVIIGGGVIGLEAREILLRYGIRVTVLEAQPYLMPRVLDPETAEVYRQRLGSDQIETGAAIKRITGGGTANGVELTDGRIFPCELVIVSCGVKPNTAIAAKAGLDVQRGIVVSDRMETSAADVYACGDCALYRGQCRSLWKVAMEQGRAAGQNACGLDEAYHDAVLPVTFYSPAASLFALGNLAAGEQERYRIVTTRKKVEHPFLVNPRSVEAYSRLVYENGRLVGAALIGDLSAMPMLQRQITGEESK